MRIQHARVRPAIYAAVSGKVTRAIAYSNRFTTQMSSGNRHFWLVLEVGKCPLIQMPPSMQEKGI